MKRFSDRNQLSTLSELNVTPLLDLAFVLLIIFMITTPLMENTSDLIVPTARAKDGAPSPSQVETIAINRDAVVSFKGEPVEDLEAMFRGMKASRPELAVAVRADRELPVQELVRVMDALKRAGVTRVGLWSTEPTGENP